MESFSPCIKCADLGCIYSSKSEICRKCQYFILVNSIESIISKNPDCKYCKKNYEECMFCYFVLDFEKLISDYENKNNNITKENLFSPLNEKDDEFNFSDEDDFEDFFNNYMEEAIDDF